MFSDERERALSGSGCFYTPEGRALQQRGKSGAGPSSYWLISKRERNQTEVLTLDVGGEEAVPVFSFEEEAQLFWLFEALDTEWHIRETTLDETRHLLLVLRTRANTVVLDPLPAVLGRETNLLVSLGREEFTRRLYAGRDAV